MSAIKDILENPMLAKVIQVLKASVFILIGIGGNLVHHYSLGTFSRKQIIVSTLMGLATGFIAYQICISNGWGTQAGYVVPISTMLGEKLIGWSFKNVTTILDKKAGLTEEKPKEDDIHNN